MFVATAGSVPVTAVSGPVAVATASSANGMYTRSPVFDWFAPGPLDEREKSMQFGSGGFASCVAVVFGLIDLRSAASPSPEPFGRVSLHPGLGLMVSCGFAGSPGLTASHDPTIPPPMLMANWSITSWVVSEPTATYVVVGS